MKEDHYFSKKLEKQEKVYIEENLPQKTLRSIISYKMVRTPLLLCAIYLRLLQLDRSP